MDLYNYLLFDFDNKLQINFENISLVYDIN